ncbi:CDP-glycerol glycerophosphotransferase family protein [Butyrivibrio sp. WCE2006]|uniref:CDP-glycerol glycerophosphotransferase family protein n=1 Tax=Butyrivibrio sp. WCE2006 TaxID=1410611 RepID=UPI0005D28F20|nr:CDP-glycerol glycerophosphotransferase family protein [Butyrivibrio sp. WCE2006]
MNSSFSEKVYILGRKVKAFIYGIPFSICRIFPIDKNKIVLWTVEGQGGYGCSPKYIAEELLKQSRENKSDYRLYWILTDTTKEFPKEIIKVKDSVWNRAYHMTTARFWIGNTRTFYGTRKRKGTTYIQTWHGSLSLKPIGKYRGENFSKMAYLVSKADSDLIDILISGSDYCTKMWRDGLFYDGRIEQLGIPRCDVLINEVDKKHKQFREEYNLPKDCKIVIYAPTFRGGSQGTFRSINENVSSIDFDRVIDAFEKRFGGTWYVFLRLHPQLLKYTDKMAVNTKSDRLIDVTVRPDMNEIMAATDAIITDYSTVIFEGFLTGQPGFIYADDLEEYVRDRGNMMFELNEIPFSIATNNDELINNILKFDDHEYRSKSESFIKQNGIMHDGKAVEKTIRLLNI